MDQQSLNQHLSRISTQWSIVFQAHENKPEGATTAQKLLMQRYSGAVYRYLLGAVRDPDVASELAQEFAVRFLRGAFRRANPERGRFRDYVKTVLIHLVDDHHRSRRARPQPLSPEVLGATAAAAAESADPDRDFLRSWRQELLDHTWKALAREQPTYHAVLLCRVESPDLSSAQMAEQLSARLGKPLTAVTVRKAIQRAHEKFADLLIKEVAYSLDAATPEQLEEELRELELLKYCRSALERRGGGEQKP
jgi:RNA polymerase sigma-70 factor (ECF subfamily)